ncbi:MAG TPA: flagellar motor switch protein FliM, partial [Syntrophobacteraceae bacterium]|nr:flagellar motor switch protein FliM [Syntrophobacteraceae bacterium]
DRFAKLFRNTVSGSLRKVLDVTVTQTEMVKFGEFIRTLPVPTSLHILKMDPLRGHVLLVVESRLIFNLLDCFFGGTGKTTMKIEGRDFTAIEQKVIQKVVQMVLKDLELSWKPVVPINFQFSRSEINPQFATIVPPTELIIAIRYDLELDYLIGKITLCLPYSTIEPIRAKLYARYQSEQLEVDLEWIERVKRQLRDVEVEMVVELGKGQVTPRELLQISQGDTIVLDQRIDEPLTVRVEGIPKYRAFAGTSKGVQVVKIHQEIDPLSAI